MMFRYNNELVECSVETARVIRAIAWNCYVESKPKVDTTAYLLYKAISDVLKEVGDEK